MTFYKYLNTLQATHAKLINFKIELKSKAPKKQVITKTDTYNYQD